MLEKQVSNKVKRTIFDTYEDAKLFQLKYGGEITFTKADANLQGSRCRQRC